jgi:deoxycytidylate deaminase
MRLAIKQAQWAPHDKWRVGAVLVRGGSVISTGYNRYRNHPAQVNLEGISYHAEEACIMKAGDPHGATIYVARITKSGLLGMAKPCVRCQELLLSNGVRAVVYTTPTEIIKLRSLYELDV